MCQANATGPRQILRRSQDIRNTQGGVPSSSVDLEYPDDAMGESAVMINSTILGVAAGAVFGLNKTTLQPHGQVFCRPPVPPRYAGASSDVEPLTRILRRSSPIPSMIVWPVSSLWLNLNDGSIFSKAIPVRKKAGWLPSHWALSAWEGAAQHHTMGRT